jgi:UDP-GlcNAc:undecaprenyl-phosphate GlcNAc-1-phosphate transferase
LYDLAGLIVILLQALRLLTVLPDILFSLIAAGICFLITPAIRRGAIRLGALDEPGGRRAHTERAPRLGGLAVLISVGGTLGIGLFFDPALSAGFARYEANRSWLLGGALIIAVLGVADDLQDLPPKVKLIAECMAGMLAFASGSQMTALVNPFTGEHVALGWLSLPVTLLWVVGLTNAFNLIDGLDGLATGVALIAAVTVWFIASTAGRGDLALVAISLAGALAGFLLYNFHPASIFLGDSGSLFLGYTLSVLSLEVVQTQTADVQIVILVVIFAFPIADLLLAAARRFLAPFLCAPRGTTTAQLFLMGFRSILQPDREHIHHRLIRRGFSHRQAVLVLYGVCALSGAMAFLLLSFP